MQISVFAAQAKASALISGPNGRDVYLVRVAGVPNSTTAEGSQMNGVKGKA